MTMRFVATIQGTKLEPAKPEPLSSAAQACATARPLGEEESAGIGSLPVPATVKNQSSAQPPHATVSHQDLDNCVELDSEKKLNLIVILNDFIF